MDKTKIQMIADLDGGGRHKMCSECLMMPCHPRCPNAPDPIPVKICSMCGRGIMDGDEYLDLDGRPICEGCLSEMTAKEVLELVGERLVTA